MPYTTMELRRDNGTGWIVLNRPEVKNALNITSFYELRQAIAELEADDTVKTIIIMGKGGNFSSGRDFRDKTPVPPDFEERRTEAFSALEYCSKPTIAAVAGWAITGGMTIMMSCDIVIASEDAILQDTHAKIGAITLRASRMYELIGPMRTKELLFTSRRVMAAEALQMGLVNKVVPREQLEQAAAEMAAQINQHDPQVVGAIKKMVNRVIRADQAAMLDREELEKRRFNDLVSEQKAMAKGRDILPGKG